MREVAQGSILAFILKLTGSGLAFGFNVAIGRLFGVEGAGLYFLALAITTTGSIIGRIGLDNALLRFIATHATREEWGKVLGVHALGIRIAVAASTTISLLGFLLAPWIAGGVFDKPALTELLSWMSLSILPLTLLELQAESLKGLKRIGYAMLIQGIGVPFFGLLLITPLVHLGGIEGVAWAYLIATLLLALLGTWGWRRAIAGISQVPAVFPLGDLWSSCKHLFMTSLMNRAILPWGPLFFLGFWVSSQEIGIFGAASRVAMLVSFLLLTINNVIAPKFAELYSKGDLKDLGQTARQAATMVTLLVSPIFFMLLFQSDWVMGLYGEGFERGGTVLTVLVIGQMVNVITGSVGSLLMMSGNEKLFNYINALAFVLQIALLVLLVPSHGAMGAAIASAVSVVLVNITAAISVYRIIGIVSVPFLSWTLK
jgi:O-antigen/teichoic acid export membrane protein